MYLKMLDVFGTDDILNARFESLDDDIQNIYI